VSLRARNASLSRQAASHNDVVKDIQQKLSAELYLNTYALIFVAPVELCN
jgi:hypothetical protein